MQKSVYNLAKRLRHYWSPCIVTCSWASVLAPAPREGPIKHDGRRRWYTRLLPSRAAYIHHFVLRRMRKQPQIWDTLSRCKIDSYDQFQRYGYLIVLINFGSTRLHSSTLLLHSTPLDSTRLPSVPLLHSARLLHSATLPLRNSSTPQLSIPQLLHSATPPLRNSAQVTNWSVHNPARPNFRAGLSPIAGLG